MEDFEAALNRRCMRVYRLKPERVRIDTTSGSGYWEITEDGLCQLGHSKDHRPDLPQLKVVLATLDPLGMPVATQVVGGIWLMTRCIFQRSMKCVGGWEKGACCTLAIAG